MEEDTFATRVGLVGLRGTFSVASASKLISTISVDVQEHEVIILDFSDTVYMDDSAALVVEQLIDAATEQGAQCIVMGLDGLPCCHPWRAERTQKGAKRPIRP